MKIAPSFRKAYVLVSQLQRDANAPMAMLAILSLCQKQEGEELKDIVLLDSELAELFPWEQYGVEGVLSSMKFYGYIDYRVLSIFDCLKGYQKAYSIDISDKIRIPKSTRAEELFK